MILSHTVTTYLKSNIKKKETLNLQLESNRKTKNIIRNLDHDTKLIESINILVNAAKNPFEPLKNAEREGVEKTEFLTKFLINNETYTYTATISHGKVLSEKLTVARDDANCVVFNRKTENEKIQFGHTVNVDRNIKNALNAMRKPSLLTIGQWIDIDHNSTIADFIKKINIIDLHKIQHADDVWNLLSCDNASVSFVQKAMQYVDPRVTNVFVENKRNCMTEATVYRKINDIADVATDFKKESTPMYMWIVLSFLAYETVKNSGTLIVNNFSSINPRLANVIIDFFNTSKTNAQLIYTEETVDKKHYPTFEEFFKNYNGNY